MNSAEREKIHDKRHLAYRLAMLNNTESKRKEALVRSVEVEESEILGIIFESVKMLKILAEQPKRCFDGIDLSILNQDMSSRKQWAASLEISLKLLVKLSLDALDEVKSFNNVADEYFYAKMNADYHKKATQTRTRNCLLMTTSASRKRTKMLSCARCKSLSENAATSTKRRRICKGATLCSAASVLQRWTRATSWDTRSLRNDDSA